MILIRTFKILSFISVLLELVIWKFNVLPIQYFVVIWWKNVTGSPLEISFSSSGFKAMFNIYVILQWYADVVSLYLSCIHNKSLMLFLLYCLTLLKKLNNIFSFIHLSVMLSNKKIEKVRYFQEISDLKYVLLH